MAETISAPSCAYIQRLTNFWFQKLRIVVLEADSMPLSDCRLPTPLAVVCSAGCSVQQLNICQCAYADSTHWLPK